MSGKSRVNPDEILSMIREGIPYKEIADAYGYSGIASVSWVKCKYKRLIQGEVVDADSLASIASQYGISMVNAEWLYSLRENESGTLAETQIILEPKSTSRVVNAYTVDVKMMHWDTDDLLDIIEEPGYYILDVSNPNSPVIKLLSELSLKQFKEYSNKPGAVLINAGQKDMSKDKPNPTVIGTAVVAEKKTKVGIERVSPSFEDKYDDWRNVPTPRVCV